MFAGSAIVGTLETSEVRWESGTVPQRWSDTHSRVGESGRLARVRYL